MDNEHDDSQPHATNTTHRRSFSSCDGAYPSPIVIVETPRKRKRSKQRLNEIGNQLIQSSTCYETTDPSLHSRCTNASVGTEPLPFCVSSNHLFPLHQDAIDLERKELVSDGIHRSNAGGTKFRKVSLSPSFACQKRISLDDSNGNFHDNIDSNEERVEAHDTTFCHSSLKEELSITGTTIEKSRQKLVSKDITNRYNMVRTQNHSSDHTLEEEISSTEQTFISKSIQSAPSPVQHAFTGPLHVETDATQELEFTYSMQSSAYVQNLAEICYTIQNDLRWRVSNHTDAPKAEPLFCWSKGDDLSIVTVLSRYYQPLNHTQKPSSSECWHCSCLLCKSSGDKSNKSNGLKVNTFLKRSPSNFVGGQYRNSLDDAELRRVHLFSRLFYRKGPWFRVDDIFLKYYAPKNKDRNSFAEKGESDEIKEISSMFSNIQSSENSEPLSACLDVELLKAYIESVTQLLCDIQWLLESGWIRCFCNEAECGKTIDRNLLRADEKKALLSKLGLSGKRVPSSASPRLDDKNDIWRQMHQQQALSFQKGHKKSKLLPVIKHVDNIIFRSLIQKIAIQCSLLANIPSAVMRSVVSSIISSLRLSLKSQNISFFNDGTCIEGLSPTIFRLREAPTLTIQRCARLYLCASHGPGNMRSDGSNAWRSLLNVHFLHNAMIPMEKIIPPPSQNNWHRIQYPGLASRFGIRSFGCIDSFQMLSWNENDSIELNKSVLCQVFSKPEAFTAWEICVDLRDTVDYLMQLNEMMRYNQRRQQKGKDVPKDRRIASFDDDSLDFFGLLSGASRIKLIKPLFMATGLVEYQKAAAYIENQIQNLLPFCTSGCERMLCIIGIISLSVLVECNLHLPASEILLISKRPWMRHLFWPGCLSYILWDLIPLFERLGKHELATLALEVLLFGYRKPFDFANQDMSLPAIGSETPLAPFLLSRRARGKGLERLLIDFTHTSRHELASITDNAEKRIASNAAQNEMLRFSQEIINKLSQTSTIGFSAIRSIARRLKKPLSSSLQNAFCLEAAELGIRLENSGAVSAPDNKYSDWSPTTDRAIANSLSNDTEKSRCLYVGHEDDEGHIAAASLNVEQLALEFYRTGRLPFENYASTARGGWIGFHDEGGHVRALFRILCSAPILGMDWGCSVECSTLTVVERSTIHLTPYQDVPFDLHVGFEVEDSSTLPKNSQYAKARGFYFRRQDCISSFLEKLVMLNNQEVADLVHESILSRLRFMIEKKRKDPFLERDVAQSTLLSLIAAGCGGKQLASIFRCFLFDYRHYSGGLPDLLLVRALQLVPVTNTYVVLTDWLSSLIKSEAGDSARILIDRDDEFLGCSKVGDSGGRRALPNSRPASNNVNRNLSKLPTLDAMGEKLLLQHGNCEVIVECMMVEVKSSNDRLDHRQEDWLNVLDNNGNARVCKFEKSKADDTSTKASPENT